MEEPTLDREPVLPVRLLRFSLARPVAVLVAWALLGLLGIAGAIAIGLVLEGRSLAAEVGAGGAVEQLLQDWLFPLLICGLLLIGVAGRVRVYDSMISGASGSPTISN